MNFFLTKLGYSENIQGFSSVFSWWRNHSDYRFWSVCGHTAFSKDGRAVTDDYGDLVEVI